MPPVYAQKRRQVTPFGSADVTDLMPLLKTPLVRRLEESTQLGVNFKVFPTATHNRLGHSIAVSENGARLLQELYRRGFFQELSESDRRQLTLDIRIAGLLHDGMHAPFGHPPEYVAKFKVPGLTHKVMTVEAIHELDQEIRKCGSNADRVVSLLDEDPAKGDPRGQIIYARHGADKGTYLKQDQYFAGVRGISDSLDLATLFGDSAWVENKLVLVAPDGLISGEAVCRMHQAMYLLCYFDPECLMGQRFLEKSLEIYSFEADRFDFKSMYRMTESQMSVMLEKSDNRRVRECYRRLSEFGSVKAAIAFKMKGYEARGTPIGNSAKEVGISPEHVPQLASFYENPMKRTELELRLAKEFGLKEDELVVTTLPDLPKVLPKDILLIDETGAPAQTLFYHLPNLQSELERNGNKGYSFVVWVTEDQRTKVSDAYKTVAQIIETHSKVELGYDVGARREMLFTDPPVDSPARK